MVLILSGAGGGSDGGGPAPSPAGPRSVPRARAPASPPPSRRGPAPGAATTNTMLPAALLLLPSLLALLAHGKGPWRPAAGRGRGQVPGWEGRAVRRPAPRIWPFRRLRCPRTGRAGRGAGSAGGKLPRLPPFAPGRDLAFNHLPGSNGISLLQFITPPPPRTHSRAHPRATSPRSREGGPRAVRLDGPARRRGPAFPAALQTSLDFAAGSRGPRAPVAEGRGGMAAGPGVGTSLTSLDLAAAKPESEPRVRFQGKSAALGPATGSALGPRLQRLRSWDR